MTDSPLLLDYWFQQFNQDIAKHYEALRAALKASIYRDYPHHADQIWGHLAMALIGVESKHHFVATDVMDMYRKIVEKYV